MSANRAASIHARLKQHTDTLKQDFNLTLTVTVTVLGMTNTRMNDLFDFALLLRDDTLEDEELRRAIEATFARRKTALPSAVPIGLSEAFAGDATKQVQWRAFLNRNKLEPMDLRDVIAAIRERVTRLGFTAP